MSEEFQALESPQHGYTNKTLTRNYVSANHLKVNRVSYKKINGVPQMKTLQWHNATTGMPSESLYYFGSGRHSETSFYDVAMVAPFSGIMDEIFIRSSKNPGIFEFATTYLITLWEDNNGVPLNTGVEVFINDPDTFATLSDIDYPIQEGVLYAFSWTPSTGAALDVFMCVTANILV